MSTLLNDFQAWLNRRYKLSSVRGILSDTAVFIDWCEEENIDPEKTTYKELLDFIGHCTAKGNAKGTMNQKITSLKQFFNYQIATKKRGENPALELRIKNQTRSVPLDLIKYEELEKLYRDYPAQGVAGKRNKSVIGLMVYQGLNAAELQALEVKDLKLEEGKIYIPGTGRSNDRILKLEAHQIVQLQNYLLQIRPVLMMLNERKTDKLFMSVGTGPRLGNSFVRMLNTIRMINPGIKDQRQIRASVIAHWYKLHNTRQVQYMAGHRYVSSTERYRTDKLESLQEQLEKLHPLG